MGYAFCDDTGVPQATPYFALFRREPVLPTGYIDVKPVGIANISVHALLQAIKAKGDRAILIAGHGSTTQLSMPIARRIPKALDEEAVAVFLDNQRRTISDKEAANRFDTDVTTFRAIRDDLGRVQAMRLERVELRACQLGQSRPLLRRLQAFFGCQKIAAPVSFDFFASIDPGAPTSDPAVWRQWIHSHGNATTEGTERNRFAVQINVAAGQTEAIAGSWSAVRHWVEKHLPPSNYEMGPFYLRAILMNQFIYPMDLGYRNFLAMEGS